MKDVKDWIPEYNLQAVLRSFADLCGYKFDKLDWEAVIAGVKDDEHFTYMFDGRVVFELDLFRESGESVYNIIVHCPADYEMAVSAIMSVAQSYNLESPDLER